MAYFWRPTCYGDGHLTNDKLHMQFSVVPFPTLSFLPSLFIVPHYHRGLLKEQWRIYVGVSIPEMKHVCTIKDWTCHCHYSFCSQKCKLDSCRFIATVHQIAASPAPGMGGREWPWLYLHEMVDPLMKSRIQLVKYSYI